ncbi:hypothetical protein GPECTOR_32g532 [Gonium pectorale]|uniref:AP2/ERF domain-containing protein n=1 Tax=Gonium pectorale TaxID=33097 RepID=A0A150GDK8_GONPE|nr:hypothetical protein GPECTOR_32g532 [Gonium pectorale]|eukprot:KXZ47919.1 hypothetical protein GPECTOR_32g532 [Gonium pectorale]
MKKKGAAAKSGAKAGAGAEVAKAPAHAEVVEAAAPAGSPRDRTAAPGAKRRRVSGRADGDEGPAAHPAPDAAPAPAPDALEAAEAAEAAALDGDLPAALPAQLPKGGGSAGTKFRLIVKKGKGSYRAQITLKTGNLMSPYYKSAEEAAAAADFYNYKLRGTAAELNFGLTPEQRAVLDRLSMESLTAFIKGRGDLKDLSAALSQ